MTFEGRGNKPLGGRASKGGARNLKVGEAMH